MVKKLIIGTRKSRLAQVQTQIALRKLQEALPDCRFEIHPIATAGDRTTTSDELRRLGQGVFVRQIEVQLLRKKIDLAVHSVKDLPTELPKGLKIGAVLEREDARDVYVSRKATQIEKLPPQSVIGTSSLRRRAFLRASFPNLLFQELRGNLDTRIEKLSSTDGELTGIVVAAAGIRRLYSSRLNLFQELLPIDLMPPAACQGILGIEVREDDRRMAELLDRINDPITFLCAQAERDLLRKLQGGCSVPVGIYSEPDGGVIRLTCWISDLQGDRVLHESVVGSMEDVEGTVQALETLLKKRGAGEILREIAGRFPAIPSNGKPASNRKRRPRATSRSSGRRR